MPRRTASERGHSPCRCDQSCLYPTARTAGCAAVSPPRACRVRTSARKPAAIIRWKRRSRLAFKVSRSGGTNAHAPTGVCARGLCVDCCSSEIGRPVAYRTSSARWIRCGSFGCTRAAVAGSSRTSSAWSAGQPSRAARSSMPRRSSLEAVARCRARVRGSTASCRPRAAAAGRGRESPRSMPWRRARIGQRSTPRSARRCR
jgi:hypothetical protein